MSFSSAYLPSVVIAHLSEITFINRREIVSTESGPLSLILTPNPGGEGRVRGCSRQYKYATLNNYEMRKNIESAWLAKSFV